MKRFPHLVFVLALAGVGILLLAAGAQAKTPIYAFSAGPSTTQAGAHSNIILNLTLGTRFTEPPSPCLCNEIKDITIETPAGIIGVPANTPKCTAAELATVTCPVDTQVGVAAALLGGPIDNGIGLGIWGVGPIYNAVPHPDQGALLAFPAPFFGNPIYGVFTARTEGDYGLEVKITGVPKLGPVYHLLQELWGVPADPVHDPLRFPFGGFPSPARFGFPPTELCQDGDPIPFVLADTYPQAFCGGGANALGGKLVSASIPAVPFTSNPTACTGLLTASLDTLAHDFETDHAESPWLATTGCDQLTFNPSLSAKPTTTEADSPSGLDIDLQVPQPLSATTLSSSEIQTLKVTLPAGFTVNPNAADGKLACTDAEAHFGTREQAECPEFAKIGTLSIDSSALPGPLPGALYLGRPLPGNRYRVFLTADGFSLHVKLAGVVTPDPATGQITTSFETPQTPFQEINMHIFGAEKGLLATPTRCGTYQVQSEFTPWAYPYTAKQTSTQFFTIDSGPGGAPCPGATRPFQPSFHGGVADNTAGKHTDFSVDLSRPDGDQNLTALDVKTPPGFSASLKGIPYCPQAAIDQLQSSGYTGLAELAAPSCPGDSQVGTVVAGAGAGSKPLYVGGKVYLAGPYKNAPLSLEVVIPAVSGPYDLGNVAVRVALNVDPITAQVTAVSDPLPQIIEGIPLRTRSIQVNLDRKDFSLNPTNCDPFAVNATAFGDQGASVDLSSHFQVANCADLGFGPKLSLKLNGGTKRNGHPALHATFTPVAGDANTKRVAVTLPSTEQIDQARIGSSCTRAQFAANQCPANSILGSATATSPLLDNPLKGTVYLVSAGHTLPDLVMALRGQFSIDLHGVIDTAKNGGLRTTFQTVPDVPVSGFTLNLLGAGKGLIVNNTDICVHRHPAVAQIDGQNGRTADQKVALNPPCGSARHKRHLHRARKADAR